MWFCITTYIYIYHSIHKNYEHTYIWATKAKIVAANEMFKRKMGNIQKTNSGSMVPTIIFYMWSRLINALSDIVVQKNLRSLLWEGLYTLD